MSGPTCWSGRLSFIETGTSLRRDRILHGPSGRDRQVLRRDRARVRRGVAFRCPKPTLSLCERIQKAWAAASPASPASFAFEPALPGRQRPQVRNRQGGSAAGASHRLCVRSRGRPGWTWRSGTLERIAAEGRVLVSHDRRTMLNHFRDRLAAGKSGPGLLVVGQRTSISAVAEAILWAVARPEELTNQAYHLPSFNNRSFPSERSSVNRSGRKDSNLQPPGRNQMTTENHRIERGCYMSSMCVLAIYLSGSRARKTATGENRWLRGKP